MHALHCCGAKSLITMAYIRCTTTIGLESGKTFWEGINRFLSIMTLASKFLKNILSLQIKKKACEKAVFYSFMFFLSLMCERGMRCIQVFSFLNSLCYRQQKPCLNHNFQRELCVRNEISRMGSCPYDILPALFPPPRTQQGGRLKGNLKLTCDHGHPGLVLSTATGNKFKFFFRSPEKSGTRLKA